MTQSSKTQKSSCVVSVHTKGNLAEMFKNKCVVEGTTRSAVLRDAILAYLDGRLKIVEKQDNTNTHPSARCA